MLSQEDIDALNNFYEEMLFNKDRDPDPESKISINTDIIGELLVQELNGKEGDIRALNLMHICLAQAPGLFESAAKVIVSNVVAESSSVNDAFWVLMALTTRWTKNADIAVQLHRKGESSIVSQTLQEVDGAIEESKEEFYERWNKLRRSVLLAESLPDIDMEQAPPIHDLLVPQSLTVEKASNTIETILEQFAFRNAGTTLKVQRDIDQSRFELMHVPEEIEALVAHRFPANRGEAEEGRKAIVEAYRRIIHLQAYRGRTLKDLDDNQYGESLSNLMNTCVRIQRVDESKTPSMFIPENLLETFEAFSEWDRVRRLRTKFLSEVEKREDLYQEFQAVPVHFFQIGMNVLLENFLAHPRREIQKNLPIKEFYARLPEREGQDRVFGACIDCFQNLHTWSPRTRPRLFQGFVDMALFELERTFSVTDPEPEKIKRALGRVITVMRVAGTGLSERQQGLLNAKLGSLPERYRTDIVSLQGMIDGERRTQRMQTPEEIVEGISHDEGVIVAAWEMSGLSLEHRLNEAVRSANGDNHKWNQSVSS